MTSFFKQFPVFEGKITPETARGCFLFFAPASVDEADLIIERAKRMGFKPLEHNSAEENPSTGYEKGIGIRGGFFFNDPNRIYNGPDQKRFCSASQFDENWLSPDERRHKEIMDQIAAVAAQITDISDRLARVEEVVLPRTLDKSVRLPQGGLR